MVLQEELVIFDLGNSCSNSSRKWYQYAHATVEIIERKSFPKVTKQLNGVEGTGSQAQDCLIHSVLWTTVKAQCWRAATRQSEHQAGIRTHTRNSSKCSGGQMGGGNGYQIAGTVWAQLGCDAEKQKDWKEVWLQWWPLTSRIMCVHAHVCFLLDVSLHRMCKNRHINFAMKNQAALRASFPPGHALHGAGVFVAQGLPIFFSLCQLFPALYLLSPFPSFSGVV